MKLNKLLSVIATSICLLAGNLTVAADISANDAKKIKALSKETKVNEKILTEAVSKATHQQKIIDLITKPWESKPWYKYRELFMTDKRITGGVAFLNNNRQELERAEKVYGVEKEVIVAILGVETAYGEHMGKWKIVDALYTLGFNYPKRAKYFSKEFANYVKLADSQDWPIDERMGSYAGAMGMAQFMPSSYLAYAVDFDKDGKKDLFNSPSDAVGSIANYFKHSKWTYGKPVAYQVEVTNPAKIAKYLGGKLTPNVTVGELKKLGVSIVEPENEAKAADKVKLLELEGEEGKLYYIVYPNFISITRYNTSPLYAMVVFQLSQEIKKLTSLLDD